MIVMCKFIKEIYDYDHIISNDSKFKISRKNCKKFKFLHKVDRNDKSANFSCLQILPIISKLEEASSNLFQIKITIYFFRFQLGYKEYRHFITELQLYLNTQLFDYRQAVTKMTPLWYRALYKCQNSQKYAQGH